MLNATVRARDALRRLRPDRIDRQPAAESLRDRAVAFAGRAVARRDSVVARMTHGPSSTKPAARSAGRLAFRSGAHRVATGEPILSRLVALAGSRFERLGSRIGSRDRLLPIGVALLVLIGSVSGLVSSSPAGATGGTNGAGTAARIAAVGLDDGTGTGVDGAGVGVGVDGAGVDGPSGSSSGGTVSNAVTDPAASQSPAGPYLVDGTLLKPIAVSTTVVDGSSTLITYRVKSGDTLTGIAKHFGVSMMTVWWANHLKSKDVLKVGEKLIIPPVNGTIHVVVAGETLAGIADTANVDAADIVAINGLTSETVIVGQTLVLPGATGKPIPTPKPVSNPVASSGGGGGGGGHVSTPASYGGGVFAWPVPGGYISQYFHYGHPALDIAAPYGSRIVAGASGTVIFAGWKDNGGGYQVWMAHGSGLYTTYNHMSAITVGVGQHVGRGSQVGRVGQSGWATGPHCHFEVWRGYPWENSSYRVNPLGYL